MKIELKEADIEIQILDVLELSGFHCWKAEYPIRIGNGGKGLKKSHPYIKNGISDILALRNALFFVFEVKTPKELQWWKNQRERILSDGPRNKKEKRFATQHFFIEETKKNGGFGGFTDCWETTRDIVSEAEEKTRQRFARSLQEHSLSDLQSD